MHYDTPSSFLHSSNSTIAANFEQDIPELIENQLSVSLDRVQGYPHYVKFIVTSDYPITSPITITYQVQGEFYVDKQDEWGGAQPPTESFQSRDWTRTLNVGQSVWEFKEQPDVYGTLDPGLPGKASIIWAQGGIYFEEFSDSKFHYVQGNTYDEFR